MTRDTDLNRRVWDVIASAAHDHACADVQRAKLIGSTQAIRAAEGRARDALHKIMGAWHDQEAR